MSVESHLPAYRILADDLRAQITSGRLRPGDRLPTEPKLCLRSGVSRSTVREALRLLASQNLIVTTRGVAGGSFVAHPSPVQLSDTITTGLLLMLASSVVTVEESLEVREMLEVPAAGLAARRRTEEHLRILRGTLFDPQTATMEAMATANPAFHVALAEASGNQLFAVISRPLYALTNRSLSEEMDREFWIGLDADHRAILDAIEVEDVPAAEAAARRHLDNMRAGVARVAPERLKEGVSVAGGA